MRPERTLITLTCALLMQLFAVSALSAQPASDPEAEARAALDRFLIAFNSGDNELVRQQLHFPHVTHRANSIFVADQPADFTIPYEFNRESGWARSRWDNVATYLVSDEKVNLGVDFSRLNAVGEVIAVFTVLTLIYAAFGALSLHVFNRVKRVNALMMPVAEGMVQV